MVVYRTPAKPGGIQCHERRSTLRPSLGWSRECNLTIRAFLSAGKRNKRKLPARPKHQLHTSDPVPGKRCYTRSTDLTLTAREVFTTIDVLHIPALRKRYRFRFALALIPCSEIAEKQQPIAGGADDGFERRACGRLERGLARAEHQTGSPRS